MFLRYLLREPPARWEKPSTSFGLADWGPLPALATDKVEGFVHRDRMVQTTFQAIT